MILDEKLRWAGFWILDGLRGGQTRKYYDRIRYAWKEGSSELESYFENMALSQERTRNVLNYVMKLDVVKTYRSWLIDHITANGMSYSKRVMEDGKENEDKSKRVEFKILTNSEEVIEELVQEYNN